MTEPEHDDATLDSSLIDELVERMRSMPPSEHTPRLECTICGAPWYVLGFGNLPAAHRARLRSEFVCPAGEGCQAHV